MFEEKTNINGLGNARVQTKSCNLEYTWAASS